MCWERKIVIEQIKERGLGNDQSSWTQSHYKIIAILLLFNLTFVLEMKNIELYHRKLSKTRNVAFLFAWFLSTVQFSPMLSNTVFFFLQK